MNSTILFSAAVLGLIVFVILLLPFSGNRPQPTLFLCGLISVVALLYTYRFLILVQSPAAVWMEYVGRFVMWLHGPLILLYVRANLFEKDWREFWPLVGWAMLLGSAGLGFHIVYASFEPTANATPRLWSEPFVFTRYELLAGTVVVFLHALFIGQAWRSLSTYRTLYQKQFSDEAGQKIGWTRTFLVVCAGWLIALPLCLIAIGLFATSGEWILTRPFSGIPVVMILFFALVHALERGRALTGDRTAETPAANDANPGPEKSRSRTLPGDNLQQEIEEGIRRALDDDRLYLEPELSLSKLCSEIGFTTHHVSIVIGSAFATNFYDLINDRRTREAAEMLADEDLREMTVLEIALRSGFNSKSSFNRAFKRHFGTTPTQYRASSHAKVAGSS